MANILTMLKLEELSLVDNPANPLAMAPLYKRHTPEGEIMPEEKQIEETQVELSEEVTAKLEKADRLDAENQMLKAALIENGFVIKAEGVEKKAEEETVVEEMIEVNGEKVNKSDLPEAVVKALEESAVEKREMQLTKRCEELLPNVKKEHARKLVEKLDVEITGEEEEVMDFLRAIDGLFAAQMEEVGKKEADADMTDPEDKLNALVKAYMEEHKLAKKDYAKAYAAVVKTDEGKSLVTKIYKGDS